MYIIELRQSLIYIWRDSSRDRKRVGVTSPDQRPINRVGRWSLTCSSGTDGVMQQSVTRGRCYQYTSLVAATSPVYSDVFAAAAGFISRQIKVVSRLFGLREPTLRKDRAQPIPACVLSCLMRAKLEKCVVIWHYSSPQSLEAWWYSSLQRRVRLILQVDVGLEKWVRLPLLW